MKLNNIEKPCFIFTHPYEAKNLTFGKCWQDRQPWRAENTNWITKSKQDLLKQIKNLVYTPKPGDTLFFDPEAVFPKFKLAESDYKRCIKLEKADAVVVPNVMDINVCRYAIWETDKEYYIADPEGWGIYRSEINTFGIQKFLANHNLLTPDMKFVYEGECSIINDNGVEQKIIYGTYTQIVSDKELDTLVNTSCAELTTDEFKSIANLIYSPDNTNKDLALRLLNGYNINTAPKAIRFMLETSGYLTSCSAWNSVGVKRIRQSVGFHNFRDLRNNFEDYLPLNDKERELIKVLYNKAIVSTLEATVNSYKKMKMFNELGINIKINAVD